LLLKDAIMLRRISLIFVILGLLTPGLEGQEGRGSKSDPFEKWLKEDVVYIITPEEKSVFQKLARPEEKENFIEQFWRRRDTDPTTADNEFKEEHYRRIAFANENFRDAGIPGWKTDRGRVYIVFGPPTSRERYSAGAMHQRPLYEGGGSTRTYPFEKWYYNHVEGVGDGIDLEFVDPSMTGGFRLALRPEEKDALLHMPGGGQTFYEMIGQETRQGRVRTMNAMRDLGAEGEGAYRKLSNPFIKLNTYFQVLRPPEIKFSDLKASVQTRVTYNLVPFLVANSYLLFNDKAFLVPITVKVPKEGLTYKDLPGGLHRATVHLYGSIQAIGGRIIHEFEDTIYHDTQEGGTASSRDVYFQKQLPVPPGLYKLNIVIKDAESGKLGVVERKLDLPSRLPSDLALSSLVLADYIIPAEGESLPDPFVTAMGWKVYPSLDGMFESDRSLGIYFEIYGSAIDTSTFAPEVAVTALIKNSEGATLIDAPQQHKTVILPDRVLIALVFKLEGIPPSNYELEVKVQDNIANRETVQKAFFRIVSEAKTAGNAQH